MKASIKKEINKQLKRLVSLTLMGSICGVSAFTVGAFSKKVYIQDGENRISVVTMNAETDKILEQAGISLSPNDAIIRVDDTNNSVEITIKRAFDVTISADGKSVTQNISFGTVGDIIEMSGIKVGEHDAVTPSMDSFVEAGTNITIERRCKISVTADGRTKDYAVPYVTVGEAIQSADIPLGNEDIVSADLNESVHENMEITIERIGHRNLITTESIPFEKIYRETEFLDDGVTEVAVKGVNGEREIVVQEKLNNGEVVGSETIKNKVTVNPVNELILIGTKGKNQTVTAQTASTQAATTPASGSQSSSSSSSSSSSTKPTMHMTSSKYGYVKDNNNGTFIDHNGKAVSYSSKLTGSCTAYTANAGAITSTGRPAKYGNVAVNPNIIPYGTKLYITAADGSFVYGYAVAADTGSALMSGLGLVDLYMDSVQECYNFGRRTMNVYFLK